MLPEEQAPEKFEKGSIGLLAFRASSFQFELNKQGLVKGFRS